jgi:flavin reductase (DIM6/NTAB) family NADH-FMN oxidoreductase RutF
MKKELKPTAILHPNTIVLLGTRLNNRTNITTIGDVAIAGLNPPLLMISVHTNHFARMAMDQSQTCSINLPTTSLTKEVDLAGILSGHSNDKSHYFNMEDYHDIPTIKDCPISLLCTVSHRHQIKQRVIYILTVTQTIVDQSFIHNNKINLTKLKPIVYGLDNYYYDLGQIIGTGYQDGKDLL